MNLKRIDKMRDGDMVTFGMIVESTGFGAFWARVVMARPVPLMLLIIEDGESRLHKPGPNVSMTTQPGFHGEPGLIAVNLIRRVTSSSPPQWTHNLNDAARTLILNTGLLADEVLIHRVLEEGRNGLDLEIWKILIDHCTDQAFLVTNLMTHLDRDRGYAECVANKIVGQAMLSCAVRLCELLETWDTNTYNSQRGYSAIGALEEFVARLDEAELGQLMDTLASDCGKGEARTRFNKVFVAIAERDPKLLKILMGALIANGKDYFFSDIMRVLSDKMPQSDFLEYVDVLMEDALPMSLLSTICTLVLTNNPYWISRLENPKTSMFKQAVAASMLCSYVGSGYSGGLSLERCESLVEFMNNDSYWIEVREVVILNYRDTVAALYIRIAALERVATEALAAANTEATTAP